MILNVLYKLWSMSYIVSHWIYNVKRNLTKKKPQLA